MEKDGFFYVWVALALVILYFCMTRHRLEYFVDTGTQIDKFSPPSNLSDQMEAYLKKHHIPAGQLCIIQNGQIIYNRSFGSMVCPEIYGEPKTKQGDQKEKLLLSSPPTTNSTVFRIASCSKPITSVGILILVQQGHLKLDQPAFEILFNKGIVDPKTVKDKRLFDITIRHLLRHEGGWDTSLGLNNQPFDPQYDALRRAYPGNDPCGLASSSDLIRYMSRQNLNFTPGTKKVYSNFGYNVLGRIIEATTGLTYEQFILKHVFSRVGINQAYIGSEKNRGPNEAIYCDGNDASAEPQYSADCSFLDKVSPSYGSFNIRVMDSHGGWVMTATDLAKFGSGLLDNKYISPSLFDEMYRKPPYIAQCAKKFYSLGFNVEKANQLTLIDHEGALTYGTHSLLAIVPEKNMSISAIFNHLDETSLPEMGIELKKMIFAEKYAP